MACCVRARIPTSHTQNWSQEGYLPSKVKRNIWPLGLGKGRFPARWLWTPQEWKFASQPFLRRHATSEISSNKASLCLWTQWSWWLKLVSKMTVSRPVSPVSRRYVNRSWGGSCLKWRCDQSCHANTCAGLAAAGGSNLRKLFGVKHN